VPASSGLTSLVLLTIHMTDPNTRIHSFAVDLLDHIMYIGIHKNIHTTYSFRPRRWKLHVQPKHRRTSYSQI
jgi:hypothetical protein